MRRGAWRTDIRIRIRHGYPDFRIRLRALVITRMAAIDFDFLAGDKLYDLTLTLYIKADIDWGQNKSISSGRPPLIKGASTLKWSELFSPIIHSHYHPSTFVQPRPSPRGNEAAAAASFPLDLYGLRAL